MSDAAQEDMERAHRELCVGVAVAGPLDGQEVTSRFPKGVVVVSKSEGKAWIYDYDNSSGQSRFLVRDRGQSRDLDNEKRWSAAEGAEYDVVAV